VTEKQILIVGCGFAGATIARILAENAFKVYLIDKRNHIGGNAFDFINSRDERIHQYGPHLLHGKANSKAIKFLNKFTKWTKYEHKVRALLNNNKTTPLPVNRTTLEDVFGISLNDENQTKLFLNRIKEKIINPKNTDELFLSNVGETLSNIFFRPYTKKMWGIDPKELEVSIGARLPVRTNRDERYFTDNFQALPTNGYTYLFENILDHKNIKFDLNTNFDKEMEKNYNHIFLCIPIDAYFDYCYGHLPYRSLKFKNQIITGEILSAPQINFTDDSIYTRQTQWDLLPNSGTSKDNKHTVTLEIPVDIRDNPGEYYYPVQTRFSRNLYKKYFELSKKNTKVTFCGRTGLFRYIDMIPCVEMHIHIAEKFLLSK
tara:strand:- start:800 stop:1921 length:1122 start_codon:yes stop_codon:yes gene_type:complete